MLIKRFFSKIKAIICAQKIELKKPPEMDEKEFSILSKIIEHNISMASHERLLATYFAVKHIVDNSVQGVFVECGVWRGGNSILAKAILEINEDKRPVYLYDTFAGMTLPTDLDYKNSNREKAINKFYLNEKEGYNGWCYASIDEVKANFTKFDLMDPDVKFVCGPVEETLVNPNNLPSEPIAILRLDTDWYASTACELEILGSKIPIFGILIIDDYGHWNGARVAVDEFLDKTDFTFVRFYSDYTGRAFIRVK